MALNLLTRGRVGAFSLCCHKGSLIVMFMHVNVSQNTLWALLCVKRTACITVEPGGPVCGCMGELGATEPISVSTAQCAQCIGKVLDCFHSSGLPTLGECCKYGKLLKGPHKALQTAIHLSCKYFSWVTMFRHQVNLEHIVTHKMENRVLKLYLTCEYKPIL